MTASKQGRRDETELEDAARSLLELVDAKKYSEVWFTKHDFEPLRKALDHDD